MSLEKSLTPQDSLGNIQSKIEHAHQNLSLKVNSELLTLYYEIGSSIIEVQNSLGWGSQIIDQLANHIKKNFPSSTGFSVRNLKYMRSFSEAYPDFPFCASLTCTKC